ncbi:MAG: HAMP domain-containing protein [Thermoleophilia bacterium]|nr:HAMP domain-containing protein [Thermoleophilia bacterium]
MGRTDVLIAKVADTPASKIELGSSEDPEDSFSQIIRADGSLVDSTSPSLTEPVLGAHALATVEDGETGFDIGELPGVDGDARLLARPAEHGGESFVAVAGAATQDRDETLAGLVRTFLIAAPLALLLASLAGYGLATVAMRPVERMRRQAGQITLDRSGERLPLPASRDEIHRLGETLNDMLDRIEDSLDRERSFVADASHELRTPLAIVRGELELGLRPDRDLTAARAAMLSSQEEVIRLQNLTEDLLALARSDDAHLAIDRTEVSVPVLLDQVRSRFEPLAGEEGRRLTIVARTLESIYLDQSQIKLALGNLVQNALRHGEGEVSLSGRVEGSVVIFEVTDEGDGFAAGFTEEAFERFARAEAGRTTRGYGLGLAIVKAVAEAHGGTVAIEPGTSGAKVAMRIPRDAAGNLPLS